MGEVYKNRNQEDLTCNVPQVQLLPRENGEGFF